MSIAVDNIKSVLELLSENLSRLGFEEKSGLEVSDSGAFAVFAGEKGALKIQYENESSAKPDSTNRRLPCCNERLQ